MSSLWRGLVDSVVDLLRPRRQLAILGGCLAIVGLAHVERRVDPTLAWDRVLATILTLGLPLYLVLVTAQTPLEGNVPAPVEALARHGANRRMLILGHVLGRIGVGAALAIVTIALAQLIVSTAAPVHPWARELLLCSGIACLAAMAYGLMWAAGGSLRRFGPWLMYVLDAFLGRSTSGAGLPFPSSHVRSLLGSPNVAFLSSSGSSLALLLLSAAALGILLWRTER